MPATQGTAYFWNSSNLKNVFPNSLQNYCPLWILLRHFGHICFHKTIVLCFEAVLQWLDCYKFLDVLSAGPALNCPIITFTLETECNGHSAQKFGCLKVIVHINNNSWRWPDSILSAQSSFKTASIENRIHGSPSPRLVFYDKELSPWLLWKNTTMCHYRKVTFNSEITFR